MTTHMTVIKRFFLNVSLSIHHFQSDSKVIPLLEWWWWWKPADVEFPIGVFPPGLGRGVGLCRVTDVWLREAS